MTRTEFINYMKHWYMNNTSNEKMQEDSYVDKHLLELETSDADGDFIFENSNAVIGKYYYCDEIPSESSKDGKSKTLCFIIYGISMKDKDGDLQNYEEFEYIIL